MLFFDVRSNFKIRNKIVVFLSVFFLLVLLGFLIVEIVFKNQKGVDNIKKGKNNNVGKIVKKNVTAQEQGSDADVSPGTFHIIISVKGFRVDSDVVEGKTDNDLNKGVVHQVGSAFPSEYGGNVVITGHRWYPGDGKFSKIFENIDRLQTGDKVVLTYKNKKYIYLVKSKNIVEPENVKFLKNTVDPQLTIYTCHPKFTANKRLVYTAFLKEVKDLNK